ncbi:MAG: ACT domain-containing protein, partial [Pseudonocardiaceae bacterium]
PWLSLTQKLGTVLAALTGRPPASLSVRVRGELAAEDVSILQLAALRGIFAGVVEAQVTFVNAPRLAEDRGVSVSVATAPESPNHRSVVSVQGAFADGSVYSVSGTLSGPAQVEKLVEINGRHFDLRAEGEAIFVEYPDRPGVMGTVGTLLGGAGINIEAAQISQTTAGTDAIMMLRVDRAVPDEVLEAVGPAVGARTVRSVTFG